MGVCTQFAVHAEALPNNWSAVQLLPSLQLVGHELGGSQVSPGSMTPLPQLGWQSGSLLALQPAGQQPSEAPHAVMAVCWQRTLHSAALPTSVSAVQALPSLQLVGQELGGSQVSLASMTPLPHTGVQLGSLVALQPEGQQPSSRPHWVTCWRTQRAVQFSAEPCMVSVVQGF
jgi:hypothetical protein